MRGEVCEIREKEAKSADVLIRNLDKIDCDEDGGWKDNKELVEYLVHNVLEQKEVEVVSVTEFRKLKRRIGTD